MDFERYQQQKNRQKNFKSDFLRVSIGKKRADDQSSNVYIFTTIQGMTLTKISLESLWYPLSINT